MKPGRGALVLALAGLLGGCALLRPDAAEDDAPRAPPSVRVDVQAPRELEALLETHLDLARLPVLAPDEPVAETELARLVAAAPAQARELLETEGYFEPEIALERVAGDPPLVRMRVRPGPRARVVDVRIDVRGDLAAASARGDPGAEAAQRALREGWGLPPGAPFRNRDWSSAKNAALARLRAEGYAAAAWASTTARVDAEAQQVEIAVVVDSGPLYRVGALQFEGLEHHEERVVRNLAGFDAGVPATEKLLLDFQERLQTSGLFDRAAVLLDTAAEDPARAPVTVRLAERRLQQATFGVGVSANVGPRASVEHLHRRVFGLPAVSRNKVEYAKLRQAWEGELSSHPGPRFYRNLVGGTVERVESPSDTLTSTRARVGRMQNTARIDRLMFTEVERAIVRSAAAREQADAVTLNYHGIWRRLDNPLLPTDGYALSLQGGVGHARSSGSPDGPFLRAYARLTGFRPLGRQWHAEGRVELGQVFKRDAVVVPDTQRFRAGGDESVRGYAYRTLAPRVNGVATGGDVLFTASAELARPLSASMPSLWGAVFVDAGNAALDWRSMKPALGYGFGVRWRSPVGPLKVDLAWGEEIESTRLHLSVGLTF